MQSKKIFKKSINTILFQFFISYGLNPVDQKNLKQNGGEKVEVKTNTRNNQQNEKKTPTLKKIKNNKKEGTKIETNKENKINNSFLIPSNFSETNKNKIKGRVFLSEVNNLSKQKIEEYKEEIFHNKIILSSSFALSVFYLFLTYQWTEKVDNIKIIYPNLLKNGKEDYPAFFFFGLGATHFLFALFSKNFSLLFFRTTHTICSFFLANAFNLSLLDQLSLFALSLILSDSLVCRLNIKENKRKEITELSKANIELQEEVGSLFFQMEKK